MNTNGSGTNGRSEGSVRPEDARARRSMTFISKPLVRRVGRIAEEAQLRARLELARVIGDPVEEHTLGRKLAERLASRDAEIDAAIDLALRTLSSVDDTELRHELAGWLEGLGDPGLAASELRKIPQDGDPKRAAAVLMRIGVLHARAGDGHGAQDALSEAASLDDENALPLELLGALASWASDAVPVRAGAEAYVRAAKRRAAAGDVDGELENLLRAFELEPASPLATAALAAAHAARDHDREGGGAGDEVLRAHARAIAASHPAEVAGVHARRRAQALERGDLGRALGAALDEGLDGAASGAGAEALDDLLVRASAFEPLAAHLELAAERAPSGRAAAQKWAELGRLLSGPLAAPERAVQAYARSVAADPTNTDALQSLRALADKTSSPMWVTEALVRASLGDAAYGATTDVTARLVAARALAQLAAERRDDLLLYWSNDIVASLDRHDERAQSTASRHEDASRDNDRRIRNGHAALGGAQGPDREDALTSLAALMRNAPAHSKELVGILVELASFRPAIEEGSDSIVSEALRVAERVCDFEAVKRLAAQRLARRDTMPLAPRERLAFVTALRRAGEHAAAAKAASTIFDACTPWAYSLAWITAAAAGDSSTRAQALAAIAPSCGSSLVSVLSAIASELLLPSDRAAARRAAEQACRAGPHDARAIRALAALVEDDAASPEDVAGEEPAPSRSPLVAVTALDRSATVAGPTAALCTRLAILLEAAGEPGPALAWARRAVSLRPGDGAMVQALLESAARLRDVDALADAVTWLLPQPFPARETAERVAVALRALTAQDGPRASLLARRALDVLGARHAGLRDAIEAAATAASDDTLRARLVERWIAAGAPAAERGPLLLTLAAHHHKAGDVEREVAVYLRAVRAGIDLGDARDRIETLGPSQYSPDAELAILEARAELLLDDGRTDVAAAAFRDLGAALWDMADDRPRAVQAWLRAAQLDSERGYATLRKDLTTFADVGYAVDCLAELVDREGDKARAGIIATEAAKAASDAGALTRAMALARTALERHPAHAEALAIAENACERTGRMQEMSPIYDFAARGALGRFGRRAAHHRAARFFESHVPMLALKHAAQAFIAVPSEGSTLTLLARTADGAQRRSVAVRTLEHVAELARTPMQRAAWLLRAANLAARDLEGARQRVDLLLKAAVISPAPVTLGMLSVATRELVSLAPDDSEAVAMRLERACDQLAKSLEGPDGARIAITFADMAIDLFADPAWGWRAIERALSADADVDEYLSLVKFAEPLGRCEGAAEALRRVVEATEKPYSNVGIALLRLVGAVAAALGDGPRSVRAFVQAAERDQDDDDLIVEVDAAIAANPEPAMTERLAKKVGVFRRSEALRAVAAKKSGTGDTEATIALLERAATITPESAQAEVIAELRAALFAAGRGEEAVLRDIGASGLDKADRASRWEDLARLREERGDAAGATDALLQAATESPSGPRWAALEQAAERTGREHIRVQALQNLAQYVDEGSRLAVRKRLARAEGARGSLAAAEDAWRAVLAEEPNDTEADVAIEALLVARASYDDLADHLARRAARLAGAGIEKDTLRAVRLRRAAILEQRLARVDEAAMELEQLLRETPGHASAQRWLADLYEKASRPGRALPLLEQLAAAATDPLDQEAIGARRVRLLLAMNDLPGARGVISQFMDRRTTSTAVTEARVLIARASQDPVELGDALEDLARSSPDDARGRSEMLVESAQAAARAGLTDLSLSRAKDAARLAPDVAATQLFARGLEYRVRGAGTREDAIATVGSLARLAGDRALEPEDLALCAFLVAEAEDVVLPGSGEAVLLECHSRVGPQALVSLGLAERAMSAGRAEDALRYFGDAVYGNLLGLRRPGSIALAAADAAESVDDEASLLRFLNEAAKDPETRTPALRRIAQLSFDSKDMGRARSVLRTLAEALEGSERAEILAQLARVLFDSKVPSERIEADRTLREAIDIAPPELATMLRDQLGGFRSRPPPQSDRPPRTVSSLPPIQPPPRLPTPPPGWPPPVERIVHRSTEPPKEPARLAVIGHIPSAAPPMVSEPSEELISSVKATPPPSVPESLPSSDDLVDTPVLPVLPVPHPSVPELGMRPRTEPPPPAGAGVSGTTAVSAVSPIDPFLPRIADARAKIAAGARDEGEKILGDLLREGSIGAADALDDILGRDPLRGAALLKVRRQAVELQPGDTRRLISLREAARADQNFKYVRAIDHVLRAFDPHQPALAPPPLSAQSSQPGMLTLLTRHSREAAGEAFATAWEGANALFAKPATAYRMTGLERVAPGPMSTLSRLYEVGLRLLDTPRFALYHRRAAGPLTLTVALLQTPSAILAGEAKDDGADVRWMLGHALASVLPQNALPVGLPEQEARLLWDVLQSSFGPPSRAKMERAQANLTDMLWQALAPRAQRRLKELLDTDDETPFELVVERANQSGRRVGMFLTGDFAHAARTVVAEHPALDPKLLEKPGGLAQLCTELPSLADLFRLAVRPEYADARWHVPSAQSSRFPFSANGNPPV